MIARLLTLEQGKPLKNARAEILSSADVLDYYAEEGKRNIGEWITSSHSRSIVLRQPVGVAALITPWNFPVDLLAWKVGPCSRRRLHIRGQTAEPGTSRGHGVRASGQ